jgi:hypothetical protein
MCDELRQSFALLPCRSDPWIWIAKPRESGINKFIRCQSLPSGALSRIQGKSISITGTIELYKGKPEIKVVWLDQIKGLDSQTER